MNPTAKKITVLLLTITTLFLGVGFFVWTVFPYGQMTIFFINLKKYYAGNTAPFLRSRIQFYPQTFVQPETRYQLVNSLFKEYAAGTATPDIKVLFEYISEKLEESTKQNDMYPHHFLGLGQSYDLRSSFSPDKKDEFQKKAEAAYKHALELFPKNQSIQYAYMINLSYQNRFSEALEMARSVLAEDDRVAESHFYLGTLLFSQNNQTNAVQALEHLEYALERNVNPLQLVSKTMYQRMLVIFYSRKDAEHLVTVLKRLKMLNPDVAPTYTKVLDYMNQYKQIPVLNIQ